MTWRDEIGRYVEWEDGKPVLMKFLHDEPRQGEREWKGKKRETLDWDVEINGVKKELQVGAYNFQAQLRDIPNLKNKVLKITRSGEGGDTRYKVEEAK